MEDKVHSNLARVLRPTRLEDYVGHQQYKEDIVSIFSRANIESLPQTVYLTGQAGNGKTTLAKLLAKGYRCRNRPKGQICCNECENCKLMDEYILNATQDYTGDTMYFDINCANRSTVDGINEVLNTIQNGHYSDEYRVVLLDEVHRLSHAAASALLGILEYMPEKTVIFLITSEDDRVLETIKTRMNLTFHINVTNNDIKTALRRYCDTENVYADTSALSLITKRAKGSLRQAYQFLEMICKSHKKVTLESTEASLGVVKTDDIMNLLEFYTNKDITQYLILLNHLSEKYSQKDLHDMMLEVLSKGVELINGVVDEDLTATQSGSYLQVFQRFKPSQLLYFFKTVNSIDTSRLIYYLKQLIMEKIIGDVQQPRVEQGNKEIGFFDKNVDPIPRVSDKSKKESNLMLKSEGVTSIETLNRQVEEYRIAEIHQKEELFTGDLDEEFLVDI